MQLSSSSSLVGLPSSYIISTKKNVAWKIAFTTTVYSFENKFGDVAKNLERSKELLVQSASVSHFQEAQDARLLIIRELKAQREHERREQTITTVNWLSSVSRNDQHERIKEKRREFPGTARWIFEKGPFCDWLRNDEDVVLSSGSTVFLEQVKTGSRASLTALNADQLLLGKPFLFSSVIDGVNDRLPWVHLIYFYCKYSDPARRTLSGIAEVS